MHKEPIKTIFIDLDETLIHTLGMVPYTAPKGKDSTVELKFKEPEPNTDYADTPVKIKLDKEVYHTILRPGANFLLFQLREIGHVYMLTRAAKSYAQAMNQAFNFGFIEDKIFDREYVKDWKYKAPKVEIATGKNVLIDDLEDRDNFEKIAFIKKFGTSKYIKVNAFYGQKDEGYTHTDINNIIETIKTVE